MDKRPKGGGKRSERTDRRGSDRKPRQVEVQPRARLEMRPKQPAPTAQPAPLMPPAQPAPPTPSPVDRFKRQPQRTPTPPIKERPRQSQQRTSPANERPRQSPERTQPTAPVAPTVKARPRREPLERWKPQPAGKERERRALAGLRGGPIERSGDRTIAERLAGALDLVADDQPPPLTHGFHTWPARFHHLLVRRLLLGEPDAVRVLDPFCGGGTTLVEAVLAGRTSFGVDANPLAVMLTRLKATPVPALRRAALADVAKAISVHVGEIVKAARRAGAIKKPPSSKTRFDDPTRYPPHVFRELVSLRVTIDGVGRDLFKGVRAVEKDLAWIRETLLLVLSSIVIKMSYQRSDTDERLVERQIARGAASWLFAARVDDLLARMEAFSNEVPPKTPAPSAEEGDARKLVHVKDGSIDLVITSPPYLGTYDYAAHHERRFGWVGIDPGKLASLEIGSRRDAAASPDEAIARWAEDVRAYTNEIARVLAPGRFAYVVVGDSAVRGMAVHGDQQLRIAAQAARLEVVATASQERPDVYAPAKGQLGGGRREHIVALHKPR